MADQLRIGYSGELSFGGSNELLISHSNTSTSDHVLTFAPKTGKTLYLKSRANNTQMKGPITVNSGNFTISSGDLTMSSGNFQCVGADKGEITSNKVKTTNLFIGGTLVEASAGELNILNGVTATTTEINKLDGLSSSTDDLNLVYGSTVGGIVNSKAVIYKRNQNA